MILGLLMRMCTLAPCSCLTLSEIFLCYSSPVRGPILAQLNICYRDSVFMHMKLSCLICLDKNAASQLNALHLMPV